jgi:flagellar biosynthesis/type III secretory pathway protein FliH
MSALHLSPQESAASAQHMEAQDEAANVFAQVLARREAEADEACATVDCAIQPGVTYTVVHGRDSVQIALDRLVIPAQEVETFTSALQCAEALAQLLSGAQARIERELSEARDEGFREGRRQAHELSAQEVARSIDRMVQSFQAHEAATRQAIGTLALAVVGKLSATLGAERMVPALVEQAIQELLPQQALRVRVPPELAVATRRHLEGAGLSAEVRADESLGGFDCTIDCAHGQQLAGLDTQLAAVAHALGAAPPSYLTEPAAAHARA